MSFLEELKKKKSKLNITNTTVKTADGSVYIEEKNSDGLISKRRIGSSEGFIVDLKPDLQVAVVLPGLLMGSQDVTQDEALLHKYGITHILSVGVQVPQLHGLKYTFLEVLDLPEFDMTTIFKHSFSVINDERCAGGVVFVHCNAGVSRSAAIVIAYLMKHKQIPYVVAYDLVKAARSCIKPNEGFVKQLKCLEIE